MYGKAFAPEYQGALTTLSVNASLTDVLAAGTAQVRAAERAGEHGEAARSGLAGRRGAPQARTGRGRRAGLEGQLPLRALGR